MGGLMNSNTTNSNQNTAQNSATNSNSATNYGSNTGSANAQNTANTSNTVSASGPSAAGQALINQGTGTQNTLGNISSFMSPYTSQVLNAQTALENQQNQVQQNQLTGNAIAQGALGGDRAQAQAALLAGQQNLANNATNTGILQQGFNTALGAAQTQAAQNLQGAGLSGTQSSTGTQQLGSTQGQQASSTLGGTQTAQSSATANAGTGSGSSTQSTNPGILTFLGLGGGLLGSHSDGGAIHRDAGGSVTTSSQPGFMTLAGLGSGSVPVTYNGQTYYVPQSSLSSNSAGAFPAVNAGPGMSPQQAYQAGQQVSNSLGSLFTNAGNYLNNSLFGTSPTAGAGGWQTGTQPTAGLGTNLANAAGSGLSGLGSALGLASGGTATAQAPMPSIGNIPSSSFYTPVSMAPVQAATPSLTAPSVAAPVIGAPQVSAAAMPSVPFPSVPTASSGKGSGWPFASGGAVKRFDDGGAATGDGLSSGSIPPEFLQFLAQQQEKHAVDNPQLTQQAPAPQPSLAGLAGDSTVNTQPVLAPTSNASPLSVSAGVGIMPAETLPAANAQQVSFSQVAPPSLGSIPATGSGGNVAPVIADGPMPRGLRNNNPGNIEFGTFARAAGATGSDGRFAIFPSAEAGQAATDKLLQHYGDQGINTIQGVVSKWAPSPENDVNAYAGFVAKQMGIAPDAPLDMGDPKVRSALSQAITRYENGTGSTPSSMGNLYSRVASVFGGQSQHPGSQTGGQSPYLLEKLTGMQLPESVHTIGDFLASKSPFLMAAGSGNPTWMTSQQELELKNREFAQNQAKLLLEQAKTAYEIGKPVETGAVPTVVTDPLGIPHIVNVPHMAAPVVDPVTGKVTFPASPAAPAGAAAGTPQPDYKFGSNLRGQAYLDYAKTLNPQAEAYAEDIIAGRETLPNVAKANPGIGLLVSNMVRQADPTYNANRYRYAQAYTDPKGKVQQSVNALETAFHHAEIMHDSNANGNVSETYTQPTNWLYHGLQRGYGATALENYDASTAAFGREFDKVLTGGVGSSGEREASEGRVSSTKPTQARMSGNAANVELMLGKMLSYENDWQKNQGPNAPPPPSLTDDERAVARKIFAAEPNPEIALQRYKRLSKDPRTADLVSPPVSQGKGNAGSTAAAPITVKSPDEAKSLIAAGKLKSGDQFIDEHGTTRTVH